jgi:hypothetical protein
MNKKNQLRNHFESILGFEFSDHPTEIAIREPIGVFNTLSAEITSREINGSGERGKRYRLAFT